MINFSRRIYRYTNVSSTNDLARALANKGEPEGTVVLAEEQNRGRGKWNRRWVSPAGQGIWMSIILKPKLKPEDTARITLMTAVAVVKALENYPGFPAGIKWPNDILLKDKKIAGILSEMETEGETVKFIIVGIGLNTNLDLTALPEDLKDGVTSINHELTGSFSQEKLLNEIISRIELYYTLFIREGFSAIREEWQNYSVTFGRQLEAVCRGEKIFGRAVGLSENGGLLLRENSGVITELFGS
ncbi:MAG: biotin--[acetyl-CoA-carboxylase] ligase, partial [Candidatus Ratteibacteria bacterium]|nr:biotin--[acetyl-CoA-carboxylase] ligase [Candidatus Ratteibacteria bacterium]